MNGGASVSSLKVAYADFWPGFDVRTSDFFTSMPDGIRLSDDVKHADVVVHSTFGHRHESAQGIRVGISLEPVDYPLRPHFTIDWRLTGNSRHLRWIPGPARTVPDLVNDLAVIRPLASRKFCSYVYSHDISGFRNGFFDLLDARRSVDSLGGVRHNHDDPDLGPRRGADFRPSKIAVLNKYRFTIAFENSELPGYTTEKIIDAFQADTIPIYWGNPCVDLDFDPASFISFYEHGSMSALADHVVAVDNDPGLYETYRVANPFRTGAMSARETEAGAQLKAFLRQVTDFEMFESSSSRLRRRVKSFGQRKIGRLTATRSVSE